MHSNGKLRCTKNALRPGLGTEKMQKSKDTHTTISTRQNTITSKFVSKQTAAPRTLSGHDGMHGQGPVARCFFNVVHLRPQQQRTVRLLRRQTPVFYLALPAIGIQRSQKKCNCFLERHNDSHNFVIVAPKAELIGKLLCSSVSQIANRLKISSVN